MADDPPAVTDPKRPLPPPESPALSVRNLRFSYAKNGSPVLDGVSFDLPAGGSVAVVEPSGAGKSTLARLLVRFWDYSDGEILLMKRDLRAYRQEDVRRQFGVVSQDDFFFNDTVRNNLLLARPAAIESEIVAAARQARIHEWIIGLPRGYDTFIGEQGMRLSRGERRRLSIARALLKDAPILLLDEPTAGLDAATERQILETVHAWMRRRTVLHITHRLVGLECFGQILVLDRGRIVERGSHAQMLGRKGLYRRLWDLQNRTGWGVEEGE